VAGAGCAATIVIIPAIRVAIRTVGAVVVVVQLLCLRGGARGLLRYTVAVRNGDRSYRIVGTRAGRARAMLAKAIRVRTLVKREGERKERVYREKQRKEGEGGRAKRKKERNKKGNEDEIERPASAAFRRNI